MLLTPTELERLTIYTAAELARKRKAKGLKLNHPEATAIIADEILEGAREGRSVADLIGFGSTILTSDDVMPGVARSDAHAPGGRHVPGWNQAGHGPRADPSGQAAGGRKAPSRQAKSLPRTAISRSMPGAARSTVKAVNTGDRPIQVGSHFHFFEVNKALDFDREKSLRHASRHSCGDRGALRARRGQGSDAGGVRRHRRDLRLEQPDQRLDPQRSRKAEALRKAKERGSRGREEREKVSEQVRSDK